MQVHLQCMTSGVHQVHSWQAILCLIELHKPIQAMLLVKLLDVPTWRAARMAVQVLARANMRHGVCAHSP